MAKTIQYFVIDEKSVFPYFVLHLFHLTRDTYQEIWLNILAILQTEKKFKLNR